jgi:hypothetical protein
MKWNDYPQISNSRGICRRFNIEEDLNDSGKLEKIYIDTLKEIGITSSQSISNRIFIKVLGEIILRYAQKGEIDLQKISALGGQYNSQDVPIILGSAAVGLMEDWGIIRGGPKIP